MLEQYEIDTLRMIFDKIGENKLIGIVAEIGNIYAGQHNDPNSAEQIRILNNAIEQMKEYSAEQ